MSKQKRQRVARKSEAAYSTIRIEAHDPVATELLKRAVKWMDRLVNRSEYIKPGFFDCGTDPRTLRNDIRRHLSNDSLHRRETRP